jgi:hypothetical protein
LDVERYEGEVAEGRADIKKLSRGMLRIARIKSRIRKSLNLSNRSVDHGIRSNISLVIIYLKGRKSRRPAEDRLLCIK